MDIRYSILRKLSDLRTDLPLEINCYEVRPVVCIAGVDVRDVSASWAGEKLYVLMVSSVRAAWREATTRRRCQFGWHLRLNKYVCTETACVQ